MAFKNIKANTRKSLLDYFVSGKAVQYHSAENGYRYITEPIVATGGLISDYTEGSTFYRAHIFTSSGVLDVTRLSQGITNGNNIEYLVIGGGGAGGAHYGAGGGAGGVRTNLTGSPVSDGQTFTAAIREYAISVGGGAASTGSSPTPKSPNGSDSYFGPPSTPEGVTARGGGSGGSNGGAPEHPGNPGGSGGGSKGTGTIGYGYNPSTPSPVTPQIPASHPYGFTQGNPGGQGNPGAQYCGGGGGIGAAGASVPNSSTNGGAGGAGLKFAIAGPPTYTAVGAIDPVTGDGQYFAGGGAGGGGGTSPGGLGGGGRGTPNGTPNAASRGQENTGGGGAGRTQSGSASKTNGGSGIVIVRYKLGQVLGTAKATGGIISFYNGKTIHTFIGTGTFVAPATFNETVEYVVVGGGGSGGGQDFRGGGGGAGAVLHNTANINGPSTTNVQIGGGGSFVSPESSAGNGTPSYFGAPFTAPGGGMGGGYNSPYAGIQGGSGGGAGGYPGGTDGDAGTDPGTATGDSFPGNPDDNSPTNGWGYRGGGRGSEGRQQGGGGGGAGGQGTPSDSGDYPTTYGFGGPGIQLPTTFRNPASAPSGTGGTSPSVSNGTSSGLGYQSPTGDNWYVAGGGNGGGYSKPTGVNPSVETFVPAGGGGTGAINGPGNSPEPEHPVRVTGWPGAVNSGSGGGGSSPQYDTVGPGQGGSGIVMVAYPT